MRIALLLLLFNLANANKKHDIQDDHTKKVVSQFWPVYEQSELKLKGEFKFLEPVKGGEYVFSKSGPLFSYHFARLFGMGRYYQVEGKLRDTQNGRKYSFICLFAVKPENYLIDDCELVNLINNVRVEGLTFKAVQPR